MTILAITPIDGIPWQSSIPVTNTNQRISPQDPTGGGGVPQNEKRAPFSPSWPHLPPNHSPRIWPEANVLPIMCKFLHFVGVQPRGKKIIYIKRIALEGQPRIHLWPSSCN